MNPPQRRITAYDVARAAGVSQSTVSFVMNDTPGQTITEETKRKVLDAARELDYRPRGAARSLAAGRSDVVLLSVPSLRLADSAARFVEQFSAALAERGLALVTHLAAAGGRALPDLCATVDASVVLSLAPLDAATTEVLYRAGARIVQGADGENGADQREIGRLQARHLIDRGHLRLGYALPGHPAPEWMAAERLAGVQEVCAERAVAAPVALEVDLDAASADRALARWRAAGVTGVCAFGDDTAMSLLAGAHALGLAVPADIAVVGVDDIAVAQVAIPPLTTVAFDFEQSGRELAESLAARLAGQEPPEPGPGLARAHVVNRDSA